MHSCREYVSIIPNEAGLQYAGVDDSDREGVKPGVVLKKVGDDLRSPPNLQHN